MHLLGLLIFLIIPTAPAGFWSFFSSEKSCAEKTFPNWTRRFKFIYSEDALKFSDGIRLDDLSKTDVYLTSHYLKMINRTLEGESVTLHSYAYISDGTDFTRGSGRDYLIHAPGKDPKNLSVKGGGTNERFGDLEFDIENFRANGHQDLLDGVIEYMTARAFMTRGIPVAPHVSLNLLPERLQFAYFHGKNVSSSRSDPLLNGYNQLAVQVLRELPDRESQKINKAMPYQKARLAAAMLLHNIGHGAINSENLSSSAQIIDLGHVSFGVPLLSWQYRCGVCTGIAGNRYDQTLISFLDHYFGKSSMRSGLGSKEIAQILNQTRLMLGIPADSDLKISKSEVKNFKQIVNEDFVVGSPYDGSTTLQRAHAFGSQLLGESMILGAGKPYYPDALAVSYRFILQIVFLKTKLSEREYEELLSSLIKMMKTSLHTKVEFKETVRFFEKVFVGSLSSAELTKIEEVLYSDYLPTFVLKLKLTQIVHESRERSINELAERISAFLHKHEKPIFYGMDGFVKALYDIWLK